MARTITGRSMTFRPTAQTDNEGRPLVAGRVTVIRRLGPDEADAEVGPMYEITTEVGRRVAFRDELTSPT